jgi:hypothetical protein
LDVRDAKVVHRFREVRLERDRKFEMTNGVAKGTPPRFVHAQVVRGISILRIGFEPGQKGKLLWTASLVTWAG